MSSFPNINSSFMVKFSIIVFDNSLSVEYVSIIFCNCHIRSSIYSPVIHSICISSIIPVIINVFFAFSF